MVQGKYLRKLLQIAKGAGILHNDVADPLGPIALHRALPPLPPWKVNLTHERTGLN